MYCTMGTLVYLAFGNMKEQMATQILPQSDLMVQVLILGYCFVVLFSYPLQIYPCN